MGRTARLNLIIGFLGLCLLVMAAVPTARAEPASEPLTGEMEDVKKSLLELKRDLVILEEDLLFPASSQVAVFLSMGVGEFFQLDAVTVKVNGKQVAHHLYTDKQADALYRGGIQRLYIGNVKQGKNRITAFFTGRGPSGRDYRRATSVDFDKTFEPAFVELAINDSTATYQPAFHRHTDEQHDGNRKQDGNRYRIVDQHGAEFTQP